MADYLAQSPEDLVTLRRELHRKPELSGQEAKTALRIVAELERHSPDAILTGLGGHGVAAVYDSGAEGPTVLFRCELDGLPITEISTFGWRSEIDGKGHLCGHDGHMTILCGLAGELAAKRPAKGRVVLLFQPAEETGAGAAGVIADAQFAGIKPDYAFALHNLPGLPLGAVGVRTGPFTFASEGLAIRLSGRTSHAAQPEAGVSPAAVMGRLMEALPKLPETLDDNVGHSLVTLSHARLGEAAFGISPGEADIWVTIRAIDDALQAELMDEAETLARNLAEAGGLGVGFEKFENFAAGHNDPEAVEFIEAAATALGAPRVEIGDPFRWSEDFGRFGGVGKTALFVLGSGEDHPRLHNPDFDFPDELIAPGMALFGHIARKLCG
ncbi:MAG: peptidase M20 [Rhizobiales bacterium]|nr:peptidase M20 [Hyphomicrobiales bacterium]